jgi:hypothetical protein
MFYEDLYEEAFELAHMEDGFYKLDLYKKESRIMQIYQQLIEENEEEVVLEIKWLKKQKEREEREENGPTES